MSPAMHRRTIICMLGALAIAASNPANAGDLPFGDCRVGHWTSNRNLDDGGPINKATCFTNWRSSPGEGIQLGVNARIGTHDTLAGTNSDARLREGFIAVDYDAFTWKIGRQIIAWGRADRVNPTDSLSPRDFTALVPEDEEQRQGIDAVQLRYNLDNRRALTTVVAQFEPHLTPQGLLPANRTQAANPGRAEWAVKYDQSGDRLDWSVSYFDGFERFQRHRADLTNPVNPLFVGTYERAQTLGADFAMAHGAWTLRGEASYSQREEDCAPCVQSKRKVVRTVVGADRDFWDTANINVQVFSTHRDYTDPATVPAARRPLQLALDRLNSEFGEEEMGWTFRLSNRFLNDRLKLELPAIMDMTNNSMVIRPRANYAINDTVQIGGGFDSFQGGEQSFFGSRKKNNTVFLELIALY